MTKWSKWPKALQLYAYIITYREKEYLDDQDIWTHYNKFVYTKHVSIHDKICENGLAHKILQMWKSITVSLC